MDQLARETKFVQREGKINGSLFLDLIVFNSENLKDQSLNDLSIELKNKHGIEITKQGLHERFNNYALVFLKMALEQLLEKQLDTDFVLTEFKEFNRIVIKDSVCFQIDESLAEEFPGSGGSGSEAAVRIQLEYDLLTGKINDLSVNSFNDQDAKDSIATIEKTQQGDLIVRDLAYMKIEALKGYIKRGACFLGRGNSNVTIYEKKDDQYVKLDFVKITNYMKKNKIAVLEKEVYYGSKDKLKVRLILHLLPADQLAKRLRKARINSKKKGHQNLSKEYKARAGLNIFITNANHEQIPTENVWPLYRLRWQIELMFKIWKSICHIEKVKKVNIYRLECYIYSKLIFIVLGWQIIWTIAKQMFHRLGKALSFYKAFKTLLRQKIDDLREVIMLRERDIKYFMNDFYEISTTNHLLEKRNQKPTSLEILLSCVNI